MKIAVIIGVFHMTMGVVVKGFNAVYFQRWMVLIFEVFTGLIILLGMFGWMDFLIFSKWTYTMYPYSTVPEDQDKLHNAPSVITTMINNFLQVGK